MSAFVLKFFKISAYLSVSSTHPHRQKRKVTSPWASLGCTPADYWAQIYRWNHDEWVCLFTPKHNFQLQSTLHDSFKTLPTVLPSSLVLSQSCFCGPSHFFRDLQQAAALSTCSFVAHHWENIPAFESTKAIFPPSDFYSQCRVGQPSLSSVKVALGK